jgi:t-SNARE complex subunit (syntaxin)
MAKIGSISDDSAFRDRLHASQIDLNSLVKHLMLLLKQTTQHSHTNPQVQQRLTQQFDLEYKRYMAIQRASDEQQLLVIQQVKQQKQAHHDDDQQQRNLSEESDSRQMTQGLLQDQQQQQSAAIQFLAYDLAEVQQRQSEIRNIESQVSEVATMYRELHELVNQQQESIDVLDENIQSTHDKVQRGGEQIEEAEIYARKVRRRKCMLVMIVTAVIAFLVLMIYFVAK